MKNELLITPSFILSIAIFEKGACQQSTSLWIILSLWITLSLWIIKQENQGKPAFKFCDLLEYPYFKKKTLWPLFMDGVQLPQGYSHFKEAVYFLPLSSLKFLVLILSTSEGWKAESTLEPVSGLGDPYRSSSKNLNNYLAKIKADERLRLTVSLC